ncbi:MAG: NADP-dependent oxidoreductase [Spirochaetaceae bacterium]|nr:MAG: NADP-dependent oxidoreductase [Spirochaetaceae bacterium]
MFQSKRNSAPSPIPAEMRAVVIDQFGGLEVLKQQTIPVPEATHEDVLVRVGAVGINPVDWKTRIGEGVASQITGFPFVLGWDVAGTIVAKGRRVTRFEVGDRVMGMVNFPSGGGGCAEYVLTRDTNVAAIGDSISFRDAAAVPLAALTAWQALFDTAHLQSGKRVLVHAAAGGVGHLAVQLAKWKGAFVIGTASERNHQFARSLGCDEVYRYDGDVPPWTRIDDVDVVLDTIGGGTRERSLKVLGRGGMLVTLLTGDSKAGLNAPTRVKKILVKPNERELEQIAQLMNEGALQVHTTAVSGLRNVTEAHSLSESRHVRGKIVVTL